MSSWPTLFYIGHNCCIWHEVVFLHVSAALRGVLVTNSLLPLQSFIGHNCCIWYVVVVLLASAALRSGKRKIRTRLDLRSIPQSGWTNVKTFRWDHWLQIVKYKNTREKRTEVHITHVCNDQIDSVFTDPEIRTFGIKKSERLKRPLLTCFISPRSTKNHRSRKIKGHRKSRKKYIS